MVVFYIAVASHDAFIKLIFKCLWARHAGGL